MLIHVKKDNGQALVEYLLVMLFMVTVSIQLVRNFNSFINESVGGLGVFLSHKLTTGVCPENCYFESYKNGL